MWAYLFFVSFILMQLIEYFIWRNVNDPVYNNLFSIMATLLLFIQPIASAMLITNNIVRTNILSLYLILSVPLLTYRLITKKINSTVSPLNHLKWNFIFYENSIIETLFSIGWFIFFLFPLFYQGKTFGFLFGLLTFIIVLYNYYKDKTVNSMWCWIVNSIMLYYAGYLLLYLPFCK